MARSPRRLLLAASTASLLLTLSACSSAQEDAPPEVESDSWAAASGYVPSLSAREIIDTVDCVLEGEVVQINPPRRATQTAGGQVSFDLVYRDIDLLIAGPSPEDPGQIVTARFLGGSAEGLTFTYRYAPDLSDVSIGSRLVVAAQEMKRKHDQDFVTPMTAWIAVDDSLVEIMPVSTDHGERIQALPLQGRTCVR